MVAIVSRLLLLHYINCFTNGFLFRQQNNLVSSSSIYLLIYNLHRWEALVLILFYGIYVVFMKFNQPIEAWIKNKITKNKTEPEKDDPVETPRNETVKSKVLFS